MVDVDEHLGRDVRRAATPSVSNVSIVVDCSDGDGDATRIGDGNEGGKGEHSRLRSREQLLRDPGRGWCAHCLRCKATR